MSQPSNELAASPADRTTHPNQLPPEHRALHVIVPEDAHRAAKIAAAQSGMRFRHYMIQLLRQAQPISPQ